MLLDSAEFKVLLEAETGMYQLVTGNLQGFRNPKALLSFFLQGFPNEILTGLSYRPWQSFRIKFGNASASEIYSAVVSFLTGLS